MNTGHVYMIEQKSSINMLYIVNYSDTNRCFFIFTVWCLKLPRDSQIPVLSNNLAARCNQAETVDHNTGCLK